MLQLLNPSSILVGAATFWSTWSLQIGGFPSNRVLFYFHAFLCQCGYYFLCYNYYMKNTTPLQCENNLRDWWRHNHVINDDFVSNFRDFFPFLVVCFFLQSSVEQIMVLTVVFWNKMQTCSIAYISDVMMTSSITLNSNNNCLLYKFQHKMQRISITHSGTLIGLNTNIMPLWRF